MKDVKNILASWKRILLKEDMNLRNQRYYRENRIYMNSLQRLEYFQSDSYMKHLKFEALWIKYEKKESTEKSENKNWWMNEITNWQMKCENSQSFLFFSFHLMSNNSLYLVQWECCIFLKSLIYYVNVWSHKYFVRLTHLLLDHRHTSFMKKCREENSIIQII